ncbi:MAG: adenosine/AMP deaminase, partial [Bryobacterales bacterium]|nr:adenosine/AMP deaminase [Bryobacterales bacterium]
MEAFRCTSLIWLNGIEYSMNRLRWFFLPLLCCCCQIALGAPPPTLSVEARFNEVRKSPPELYAFLLRMPKGGDLHNHLAGAVYAETFVHEAAAKRLCVDRSTYVFLQQSAPCDAGQVDAAEAEH